MFISHFKANLFIHGLILKLRVSRLVLEGQNLCIYHSAGRISFLGKKVLFLQKLIFLINDKDLGAEFFMVLSTHHVSKNLYLRFLISCFVQILWMIYFSLVILTIFLDFISTKMHFVQNLRPIEKIWDTVLPFTY